jgi:hypothetical protein
LHNFVIDERLLHGKENRDFQDIVTNQELLGAQHRFNDYYDESNAGQPPVRASQCNNYFRNMIVEYIAQNNMVRPY